MSQTAQNLPPDPYEVACDQAIAMCNGSMRGAIKALIMANEYLETELLELQTAVAMGLRGRGAADPAASPADAVPRDRADWYD